ncbi:hypothetical protein Pelo_11579 [Pelomyxa schiedti]|nr:hypothetical protein Pelo_11579 [Pelomyxa schiedti]
MSATGSTTIGPQQPATTTTVITTGSSVTPLQGSCAISIPGSNLMSASSILGVVGGVGSLLPTGGSGTASANAKVMPPGEKVLFDFSCAYFKAGFMHQGRMYMSANYVGFQSSVFSTTLLIAIKDIDSIAKRNTALLFPNAIEITVKDQKHFFSSFLQRNDAYTKLKSLIKGKPPGAVGSSSDSSDGITEDEEDQSAKEDTPEKANAKTHSRSLSESSPPAAQLTVTSPAINPAPAVPPVIAPLNSIPQTPQPGPVPIPTAAVPTSAGAAAPIITVPVPSSPKPTPLQPPVPSTPASVTPAPPSSPTFAPLQTPQSIPDLPPVEIPRLNGIDISGACPHSKYREWYTNTYASCLEDHLPIPVSQVWPILLAQGCTFWTTTLEQSNNTEIQISPWVRHADGCCNSRSLDFITPITSKLTTKKQAPVHQDQICTFEDGVLSLETVAASRDVPYVDCFLVQSLVRFLPADDGGCDVFIYCHINFIKNMFFGVKGLAERTAIGQSKEFYIVWMKCALEVVQTHLANRASSKGFIGQTSVLTPQSDSSNVAAGGALPEITANQSQGANADHADVIAATAWQGHTAQQQPELRTERTPQIEPWRPTAPPSIHPVSESANVHHTSSPAVSTASRVGGISRPSRTSPGAQKPEEGGLLSTAMSLFNGGGNLMVPRNLIIAITLMFLCLILILHNKISNQEHQLGLMAEASARTDQGVALVSAFLVSMQNNASWSTKYYEFREWNNRLQLAQESLKRTELLLNELMDELHQNSFFTDLAETIPFSSIPSSKTLPPSPRHYEEEPSVFGSRLLVVCVFVIVVALAYTVARSVQSNKTSNKSS